MSAVLVGFDGPSLIFASANLPWDITTKSTWDMTVPIHTLRRDSSRKIKSQRFGKNMQKSW